MKQYRQYRLLDDGNMTVPLLHVELGLSFDTQCEQSPKLSKMMDRFVLCSLAADCFGWDFYFCVSDVCFRRHGKLLTVKLPRGEFQRLVQVRWLLTVASSVQNWKLVFLC